MQVYCYSVFLYINIYALISSVFAVDFEDFLVYWASVNNMRALSENSTNGFIFHCRQSSLRTSKRYVSSNRFKRSRSCVLVGGFTHFLFHFVVNVITIDGSKKTQSFVEF